MNPAALPMKTAIDLDRLVLHARRLSPPRITGRIDRRMLVNFRCDPQRLASLLPPPFRPRLVHGWAMAGLCLICVFATLAEASAFFASGKLGWSPSPTSGRVEALELCMRDWAVTPLIAERVESSFFDDPTLFPPGSIALDNVLLQRGLEHEWHALGYAECGGAVRAGGPRDSGTPDLLPNPVS